jgi:hypothetical protein
VEAIVAFTGHAVFAVEPDIPDRLLGELGAGGFGGAHHPRLISTVAGADGWIGTLDMLLVARGTGTSPLMDRPDLAAHPRAAFATRIRDCPRVMGYPGVARPGGSPGQRLSGRVACSGTSRATLSRRWSVTLPGERAVGRGGSA